MEINTRRSFFGKAAAIAAALTGAASTPCSTAGLVRLVKLARNVVASATTLTPCGTTCVCSFASTVPDWIACIICRKTLHLTRQTSTLKH